MADEAPTRVVRHLVLGDEQRSKRVRLDDLAELVTELERTLREVAADLGVVQDRGSTAELVDFRPGSSIFALEQCSAVPGGEVPLAVVWDASRRRVQGKPHRTILTRRGRDSIDALLRRCTVLSDRGCPVRLADGPPDDTAPRPSGAPAPELLLFQEPGAGGQEGEESVESSTPEGAGLPLEPSKWHLRFTAEVHRLGRDRKIDLQCSGRPAHLRQMLSEDLFRQADSDDARWKRVEISAVSSSGRLDDITEVLYIAPVKAEIPLEATPMNESAKAIAPALERLAALDHLPEGWDSYQARPISKAALAAARDLLLLASTELASRGRPLRWPFVAPVAAGSVQLEWDHGQLHLEIEVLANGYAFLRAVGDDEMVEQGAASRTEVLEQIRWFHDEAAG